MVLKLRCYPLVTSLFDEEPAGADQEIFFGGINVYLQHKFSLFEKRPSGLIRPLIASGC